MKSYLGHKVFTLSIEEEADWAHETSDVELNVHVVEKCTLNGGEAA